ncbi:hypothetical protein CCUS01_16623 [Colletotrichum cuscutae]|uniref:Uncharacterized protein n=1 Tax=Colletotrichum cuscutae TaxID=1209917 RepID=A0AAI9V9G7_9PEZI|nr:hypothetical protein CCUS01_16623 [Colletotrichum cuscutae]
MAQKYFPPPVGKQNGYWVWRDEGRRWCITHAVRPAKRFRPNHTHQQ